MTWCGHTPLTVLLLKVCLHAIRRSMSLNLLHVFQPNLPTALLVWHLKGRSPIFTAVVLFQL